MKIDLLKEELITLSQAAKLVPSRKPGKKSNAMTLWRWAVKGKHGVTLEHVRKPDETILTTAAAVLRFLAAMAELNRSPPRPADLVDLDYDARQRRADALLDAAGVGVEAQPCPT